MRALYFKILNFFLKSYLFHYTQATYKIYGCNHRVKFGKGVNVNNAFFNTASGEIIIGDYSFCGHSCFFITGTHDIDKQDKERQTTIPESGRDIVVGQGVWISSNVTVLGPYKIGDNSVIGANLPVNKDIPANSIYGGVPARLLR